MSSKPYFDIEAAVLSDEDKDNYKGCQNDVVSTYPTYIVHPKEGFWLVMNWL